MIKLIGVELPEIKPDDDVGNLYAPSNGRSIVFILLKDDRFNFSLFGFLGLDSQL